MILTLHMSTRNRYRQTETSTQKSNYSEYIFQLVQKISRKKKKIKNIYLKTWSKFANKPHM